MDNKKINTISSACVLGTAAVINVSALLTPVQVYGADAPVTGPTMEEALKNVKYDWATQVADHSDVDPQIKEGTPTGSKDGNSLEDWNDVG